MSKVLMNISNNINFKFRGFFLFFFIFKGEVDPVRDLDIIAEELRLKDEDTLVKLIDKMERTVIRANDKKLKPEFVS